MTEHTAHPEVKAWYAYLVQNVFQPNATLFSYLITYGEVLVGLALLSGLFPHFSAFMGVLMNLAFLLAGTSSSNPLMLVVGLTLVLVGGAVVGYCGLDRFICPLADKLIRRTRARVAPRRKRPDPSAFLVACPRTAGGSPRSAGGSWSPVRAAHLHSTMLPNGRPRLGSSASICAHRVVK